MCCSIFVQTNTNNASHSIEIKNCIVKVISQQDFFVMNSGSIRISSPLKQCLEQAYTFSASSKLTTISLTASSAASQRSEFVCMRLENANEKIFSFDAH
jgi:hypothetical protein